MRGARAAARFESDTFIDTFLDPLAQPGCHEHNDSDCLCDVDLRKTAGMTWNKVPNELVNVVTPDDLVVAAANIWLNHDLVHERFGALSETTVLAVERHEYDEVLSMISTGATWDKVKAKAPIGKRDFTFLRTLYGVGSRKSVPALPQARVRELFTAGKTSKEILAILYEEIGFLYSRSTLSHARERMGIPPVSTGGTPRRYDWGRIQKLGNEGVSGREIANLLKQEGHPHKLETVQHILRMRSNR